MSPIRSRRLLSTVSPHELPRPQPLIAKAVEGARCNLLAGWDPGLLGPRPHVRSLDRPIKIQPSACAHCISSLRFAPTTNLDLHHVPQPHPSTHRWPFPLPATPASPSRLQQSVSRPLATFESASPLTGPKLATQPYLRRALCLPAVIASPILQLLAHAVIAHNIPSRDRFVPKPAVASHPAPAALHTQPRASSPSSRPPTPPRCRAKRGYTSSPCS